MVSTFTYSRNKDVVTKIHYMIHICRPYNKLTTVILAYIVMFGKSINAKAVRHTSENAGDEIVVCMDTCEGIL